MKKAVFLDRDGVINDGTLYYTYKVEDFVINSGVVDGLLKLQEKGYLLIVITNQSGVAKGIYSIEDVEKVHNYMSMELKKNGVTITDIFYCPHHPDVKECKCRKPGTLLFEQAIKKYDIDVSLSYMIGDSKRDVVAAKAKNIAAILIEKNENIEPYCDRIIQAHE